MKANKARVMSWQERRAPTFSKRIARLVAHTNPPVTLTLFVIGSQAPASAEAGRVSWMAPPPVWIWCPAVQVASLQHWPPGHRSEPTHTWKRGSKLFSRHSVCVWFLLSRLANTQLRCFKVFGNPHNAILVLLPLCQGWFDVCCPAQQDWKYNSNFHRGQKNRLTTSVLF